MRLGPTADDDNAHPLVGIATSADFFLLKDLNNAALGQHQFGGHAVKITSGTGAGQLRGDREERNFQQRWSADSRRFGCLDHHSG